MANSDPHANIPGESPKLAGEPTPVTARLVENSERVEPGAAERRPVEAELALPQGPTWSSATDDDLHPLPRRRVILPLTLFAITCVSTFLAGATNWQPLDYLAQDGVRLRGAIISNWDQGVTYMGCVLAILLMHEMGHFVATVLYRVPASLPYFIPFPFSPLGTMGAVIGMEGYKANRRQIFDIGLAGPLAGLVVAIPILLLGIQQLDLTQPGFGAFAYDCPKLVRLMLAYLRPEHAGVDHVWTSQLNSFYMAGWVGLLITGLNMMPVSQLDGGHVIYALFGRRAHWIARGFLLFAIVYVVFAKAGIWILMVILVTLIGTDHPPTADDRVPLGFVRRAIGYASLAIPVLCFPLRGLIPLAF